MTLPLLWAALLPRHILPATMAVLILIGLAAAAELPLLTAIRSPAPGGGPESWHFCGINGCQAAWVLAIAGGMRQGGFRLAAPRELQKRNRR